MSLISKLFSGGSSTIQKYFPTSFSSARTGTSQIARSFNLGSSTVLRPRAAPAGMLVAKSPFTLHQYAKGNFVTRRSAYPNRSLPKTVIGSRSMRYRG